MHANRTLFKLEFYNDADETIARHLSSLPSPYLVIVTALPPASPAGEHHNIAKRDLISTIEAEIFGEPSLKQSARNATNIFRPDPSSGVFHRYVFFTPALIFCGFITSASRLTCRLNC